MQNVVYVFEHDFFVWEMDLGGWNINYIYTLHNDWTLYIYF